MDRIAAIVLAAGRATRFAAPSGGSKLVAPLDGTPLLRHAVAAALASRATPVVVVTGHAAALTRAALDTGGSCRLVHNPDYVTGMAGSLQAGLAALPLDACGVLVLLGDMPRVAPRTLDNLIDAFAPARADAVVPVFRGRQGNPVLLGRSLFPRLMALTGDAGARALLGDPSCRVVACEVDDPGIHADVDTPGDLAALASS